VSKIERLQPIPSARAWAALLFLAGCVFGGPAAAGDAALAARLAALAHQPVATVAGARIAEPILLRRLYAENGERRLWTGPDGLSDGGRAAAAALLGADAEGLEPERYHASALRGLLGADGAARDDLELLLSAGLLDYAGDVAFGRLAPKRDEPDLFRDVVAPDPVPTVGRIAAAPDVAAALATLPPPHPQYAELKRALAALRAKQAAGGWPGVPEGETLEPGTRSERVGALRLRLAATDEVPTGTADDWFYDDALAAAVRRAQRRHGIEVDGRVGRHTLAALNVPVAGRIDQVRANLERWRWPPRDLGPRYVLINTAAYRLIVVEGGAEVLSMPVVVGKGYRRTPVFSSRLTQIVVNPDWTVPLSIAGQDLLPKIRREPGYLEREGFQVLRRGEIVDPATVEWGRYSRKFFPFVLRQKPGPANALGRLKFNLPNGYDVYLHDTPDRALFRRAARAVSSGCVRLGDPEALARFLMPLGLEGAAAEAALARLDAALLAQETVRFDLARPVPVHFTYFSAWADGDGTVQLLRDVYGRDADLNAALGVAFLTGPSRAHGESEDTRAAGGDRG